MSHSKVGQPVWRPTACASRPVPLETSMKTLGRVKHGLAQVAEGRRQSGGRSKAAISHCGFQRPEKLGQTTAFLVAADAVERLPPASLLNCREIPELAVEIVTGPPMPKTIQV